MACSFRKAFFPSLKDTSKRAVDALMGGRHDISMLMGWLLLHDAVQAVGFTMPLCLAALSRRVQVDASIDSIHALAVVSSP